MRKIAEESQLWCCGEIRVSIFGDPDIVLDPHPSNLPESLENGFIYVCAQLRIGQVRIDDEFAKVDLYNVRLVTNFHKRTAILLVPL
jgi:hypothetical protein